MLGADEKPDIKYSDVGGLDSQKQEIREAVELPLEQVRAGTVSMLSACVLAHGSDGPLQKDWYRSPSRCFAVWSSWWAINFALTSTWDEHELINRYRKDNAGQGRRQRHKSILHPSRRIRIRPEIPRRGKLSRPYPIHAH